MRLAPALLAAVALLAGCTTTVSGSPSQPVIVGRMQSSDPLDVTFVSFVDPAPVYLANDYDSKPADGTRLVAAQFRVHNTGNRDYLVDPITEASVIAGGKEIDTSLAATSAGVMLDQVSLSSDQTVLGYVTFEVPEGVRTAEIHYGPLRGKPLSWQAVPAGKPQPAAPWPDARKTAHRLGEQTLISSEGTQLFVTATKVTDPATPQNGVDVGAGQHVVQVDFAVRENTGQPTPGDPDLRIIALYDAADEVVRAHVHSMDASAGHKLAAAEHTTWPVQFVVPTGFVPDHVSFRPEFGDTTTTTWALG